MDISGLYPGVAGFCDEALHMYLAQGLTRKKQHLDEDEFLDVVTMPFQQLVEQVMDGTITDAKTVATTLKVKVLLGLWSRPAAFVRKRRRGSCGQNPLDCRG